jgi:hypothetical protein
MLPSTFCTSCSYIIAVLTIIDVGTGKILPGTGQAEFKCKYSAIVMKPFKGEVVDGIVNNVSKMGVFLDVGPLSVFVSSHVSLHLSCLACSPLNNLPPRLPTFLRFRAHAQVRDVGAHERLVEAVHMMIHLHRDIMTNLYRWTVDLCYGKSCLVASFTRYLIPFYTSRPILFALLWKRVLTCFSLVLDVV